MEGGDRVEGKVCLLGTTAVGKTSLSLRYCQEIFYEQAAPTIGGSFLCKTLLIAGKTVKLQIWDTAGQERFRSLAPMYYRGAHAAIIVFDITSLDSFKHVEPWVSELKRNNVQTEDIIIAVVGNKVDLEEQRAVSRETATTFADSVGATYFETSASENIGISELFLSIGKQLIESMANNPVMPPNYSLAKIDPPPSDTTCSC